MKKNFKMLCVMISIILIITITACSGSKNEVVGTDSVKKINEQALDDKSGADLVADSNEDVNPELNTFLKIITPDTTTADLKSYIKENIQYVSQEEAEKMIEFLLIYQTETIDDFMITEEFFDKIYDDMNESVIESIQDDKLKAAYKLLLDSSLIIKFSENYPYIETDWESLKEFSPYLPKDYDTVFDLYSKIDSKTENQKYNPDEVDVTGLGEDIIKTEAIISNNPSNLLKKISNELYQAQLYNLMLGPEAGHIYFWSEKNSKEYSELMDLSNKYPESIFSKIINEIDNMFIEDASDVTGIIEKYLAFGLESNKFVETLNYNEDKGEYEIFQIKIPDNKDKEYSVNNIIEKTISNYIEESNIDGDFYLSTNLKHADEQYISYEMYLEYSDLQGNQDSRYFYRTLDYLQEKNITLEEYLGASFDSIKPQLEEILGEEIDSCPEFILYPNDISLFSYNQEGGPDHIASLNLKDLLSLKH